MKSMDREVVPPCQLVSTVAFDGEGLRDREASVPLSRAVLRRVVLDRRIEQA